MSSRSTDVKENQNLLPSSKAEARPAGPGGGRKRPLKEGNASAQHAYRPRKRSKLGPLPPKNALMQLNEIKPGLQYRLLSQTGPVHAPVFVMSVEVNAQVFEGSGPTKKKAKMEAAQKALLSFVQFPDAPQAQQALGRTRPLHTDFTSDHGDLPHLLFNAFEGPTGLEGPPLPCPAPQPPPGLGFRKNPVTVLNEFRPGVRYECVSQVGESHAANFVMSVQVGTHSFRACGRSKRAAKARAAQAALEALYQLPAPRGPAQQPVPTAGLQLHLPEVLADVVSRLVVDKFSELTDGFTSPHARRKVLAGVVMTTGADVKKAEVISVSTGTKCINGEYMSDRGLALNDCHAEIVARRSLLRYLYSQLEIFLSDEPDQHRQSIFTRCEDRRGFRLKEHVQFHLYISTSPCGDARIFSPHEPAAEDQGDRHPNRRARGQLRTKIESGEGTIPVRTSNNIQTWDGVLQGERLLTMSCSDKIARWNVLGLQGSLMSYFTEPVYLSSIILGSLYHSQHLSRAVFHRLRPLTGMLPRGFTLNQPLLSGVRDTEARHPGKAPSFSVNWTLGDQSLEVVNATTGKDDLGRASRLCKHALYSRWMLLHSKLSTLRIRTEQPSSYLEAKQAAVEYHRAKHTLFRALHGAGLGAWIKKPTEQDQFTLST